MAQKSQIIDLRKGYKVIDPEAFQETLISTNREDSEEESFPVMPYAGYNFLPTDYGYRSYFGQNSSFGFPALTSRTQFVIPWQTMDLKTWFIALCEDGIWAVNATTTNAWTQLVTHTFNSTMFEQWTYCIIENTLYMYKQGHSVIYYVKENSTTFAVEIDTLTPSFLNMDGQIGIFRAGARLGFWDSLNSISWSSLFDFNDFTPSIETLAGNMISNNVIGNIVSIKESNDGFVIYSTGSIVGVAPASATDNMWDSRPILDLGVINPRSICFGEDTGEHWVWTTGGILRLNGYIPMAGKYEYEFIFPEVFDLLKESRKPIYLDCINGRYIYFQVFNGKYIFGTAAYSAYTVDPTLTAIKIADEYWDGNIEVLPSVLDGNTLRTWWEQSMANNMPSVC
jgi:hypothetical protein